MEPSIRIFKAVPHPERGQRILNLAKRWLLFSTHQRTARGNAPHPGQRKRSRAACGSFKMHQAVWHEKDDASLDLCLYEVHSVREHFQPG